MRVEAVGIDRSAGRVRIELDEDDVRVDETPFGLDVRLADGVVRARVGEPALPLLTFEVALPQGLEIVDVEASAEEPHVLQERAIVVPITRARPARGDERHAPRTIEDGLVPAWPGPDGQPPDPTAYEAA